MEKSMTSMSKALSSKARTADSQEESSWTFYFEDFLCDNNEDNSFSSGYESHSLVSDAASSAAAKKFAEGFSLDKSCKKLSFKKRKTKGVLVDDALEDTASSPVNSPKVCYLNQVEKNRKEKADIDISEEKDGTPGQTGERSELGGIGRDGDHSELKKKGLCLVPVSMFSNYLADFDRLRLEEHSRR
ncbi:hypothetical protein F0562_010137 [Nyssa sinensis]|uniref:Uncharacterized protein n=1 Tax=Nyssa sinensis TaxID=561372 RepID=A0A5J5A0N5_9ASTE|nr:hypothetical protein F0562_010137 [Nyssa sinensis]